VGWLEADTAVFQVSAAQVYEEGSVTQQPHELVWTLATAGFAARCIHVAADLGVADRIGDDPVVTGDLAAAVGADAGALDRVLGLLAAHGIFEYSDGGYRHTPASRMLCSDHPMSMRSFVQMIGSPMTWGSLSELEYSVRTGEPGLEVIEPKGLWAYFGAHPVEAEVFGRAMTAKAGAEVAAVVAAYDFGAFATIADVGGGRGHLLRAVLESAPAAEGILFDLPHVVASLDIDQPAMSATGGDFFVDALPTARS